MNLILLGMLLLLLGIILFAIYLMRRRNIYQKADRGGVVIGERNEGVIITGKEGATSTWTKVLLVMASISTIIGTVLLAFQMFLKE